MKYKRNKGIRLLNGIVDSFMNDSGELPTDRDLVSYVLAMEDWEFDQYLEVPECKERLTKLEGIQKKLDDMEQEKIARKKQQ